MSRTSVEPDVAYQTLVETMSCGVLVVDAETSQILYCNVAFSELFLTSPANLVGVCLVDLLRPEDREHLSWLLSQATRRPARAHITLMSPARSVLTCMSSALLPGVNPPALGIVLSPAVALFESPTLAAAILDQATEAIVLCDRTGRVTHANLTAHRLAGRDPCSLPFEQAFPLKRPVAGFGIQAPRLEPEEMFSFSELSAGRVVRGIHAYLPVVDRRIMLLLSAGPIGNAPDENLGTVITMTDISRQMEAENALRASENRYSQVVEQAEEGICLLDASGEILDANPSLGRILGCSSEQLIGRKIRDLTFLSELEPDRPQLQLEAERRTVIGERRIQQTDGTPRTIEGSAKLLLPNGTLLLIIRDITERRLLEKEVLEINRREERRIGRDLHDLLAQQLAGVGFLTKVLEQKLQSKGLEESKDAHRIGELVREAVLQTRSLAEGLCPIEFNADGLPTALQEICRSSQRIFDLQCRFVASDSPVLADEASAMQLYLITREVLSASKQAGARHVTVRLESVEGRINLWIEHDGQSQGAEKTLDIVRYRASLIGAELSVRREPKTVLVRCTLKHVT
ncbi:MAG: PAS domain S-box protein [Acidobacteriota bacterium]